MDVQRNRFTEFGSSKVEKGLEKIWVEIVAPVNAEALFAITSIAPPDSTFRYIDERGVKKLRITWSEDERI